MNKFDLAQTLGLLANVGVIAGIIFLAVEIQQNNELLATQARYERDAVSRSGSLRLIENPQLIRALVKAQNSEPLTQEEALLLELSCSLTLENYSFVYREYRNGLLDERSLPGGGTFRRCPGWEALWNQQKQTYDPEFIEWAEQNIFNEP